MLVFLMSFFIFTFCYLCIFVKWLYPTMYYWLLRDGSVGRLRKKTQWNENKKQLKKAFLILLQRLSKKSFYIIDNYSI